MTIDFAPLNSVRSRLGEGPVWVQGANEQWWVDMLGGTVHRHVWATGEVHSRKLGDRVTSMTPCADGSVIVTVQHGLCPLPADGREAEPVIPIEPDKADNSINDAKVGPDGRLYFGTLDRTRRPEQGALYRLEHDHTVTVLMDRVSIGNGIDWSPDEARMYFVDSGKQRIFVFAFDRDEGIVGEAEIFAEVAEEAGLPDGLTVDAAGDVWLALHGGGRLHRYRSDGSLRSEVPVPVQFPSSCTFGGPDLSTLIVTTGSHAADGEQPSGLAGAVLTATVDAVGKPAVLCGTSLRPN